MDFKKLIFVSGKGGTGKTTLGLVMAQHLALKGKKVLFVELADQSSAQSLLGLGEGPSYQPSGTPFGFDWSLMQGRNCLVEYISSIIRVEKITKSFFKSPLIHSLLGVAPGLNDLAILGKLTSEVRGHGPSFDYDHLIVDAPSTGSFLSLLSAPEVLGASVKTGPMHTQSKGIWNVLKDANEVQYFLVSLFEELPLDELEESLDDFGTVFKDQIFVIMNKFLPITQVTIDNPPWESFLKNKLVEQGQQHERLRELWEHSWGVDFFTDSLANHLSNKSQEFLRNISNL